MQAGEVLLVVAAEEVDHARERHRAVGLEVAAALELLVAAGCVERGEQPLEAGTCSRPIVPRRPPPRRRSLKVLTTGWSLRGPARSGVRIVLKGLAG